MAPRVFLIVLCYKSIDLTLDCLVSLLGQNYPACEVLIIDNASQDGTAETLRATYPHIEVVATGENLGYAGGNNVAMQIALGRGADALFLINNDTWLEPDCVSVLVEALSANSQVGVIGPMVYAGERKEVISSAGGQIDWRGADALNVGAGQLDEQQHLARKVDFINGCGILVTAAAVQRVGLLDPRYFMYWEETDWCQRMTRAGVGVWFEPAAHMIHRATLKVADLGPTTLYYVTRNRLRFFAIHTPRAQKPFTLARALHGAVRGIVQHQQAGRMAHAQATRLALWHALIGRWGRYDDPPWRGDSAARGVHRSHTASRVG
jgi:GT2 family glycosyltransferase